MVIINVSQGSGLQLHTHQDGKLAGLQLGAQGLHIRIDVIEILLEADLFMLLVQRDRSRYVEFTGVQKLDGCRMRYVASHGRTSTTSTPSIARCRR